MIKELDQALRLNRKIDVLCIGNPAISGDSVGPIVGTLFQRQSIELVADVNVIGSCAYPVVRGNYNKMIKHIHPEAFLIVIDCVVSTSVGWAIQPGSLRPGSLLDDEFEAIGDVSIKCYTGVDLNAIIKFPKKQARQMASEIYYRLVDLFKIQNKKIYIEQ